MKENEKIAYAMEHFTKGCEYHHSDYNFKKLYTFEEKFDSYHVFSNGNVNAGSEQGYLYYNNQWATVIKKGIEPDWVAIAKIKYPEGTTYICPVSSRKHKLIVKNDTYESMGGSNINAGLHLGYLRYYEIWATIVEDPLVKFEKGKWYKHDSWYLKFSHFNSNGVFIASEYIDNNNKYVSDLTNFTCGFYNNKVLLTDLTEIQKYLPDGHVDKINKEIKMFKKGDYIVLLAGMTNEDWQLNYCYKQDDNSYYLRVEKDCNQDRNGWGVHSFHKRNNDWRYATKEEIAEYDRLDKPFDVTILVKKYSSEVVHCTTQKQWDFVNEKLNNTFNKKTFDCSPCININSKNYANTLTFYQRDNNTKIYTFNEWCTKMNYVFPVDKILDRICELTYPTYVECIESKSSSYELGKIYKVDKNGDVISGINPTSKWNNTNDYQSKFKPSTTDDWNAQEINKTNIDQFTKKYLIKNLYNTNLIKVLYVTPKQKTISKEKIKKVKFLNVNIIKIN